MRRVHLTCTVTQDLIQNSVGRLHTCSTINSPSFPSSSVVPNFVKPVNIDTSQVTSKQMNAQNHNISNSIYIYLTALLKNFIQRQN